MDPEISQELRKGIARLREHWLNQAERHFRTVLTHDPDQPSALHLLGVTLCLLARHGDGLELLRRAIGRRPERAHFYWDYSVALAATGQKDAAREARRAAIERDGIFRQWPALDGPAGEVYFSQRKDFEFKIIDYPYVSSVRYGAGRPLMPLLPERLGAGHAAFRDLLGDFAAYSDDFAAIALDGDYAAPAPFWINTWFAPLDAMALFGLLCRNNPAHFVEVGSGTSTKFARLAISSHRLSTKIVSIDPQPRSVIDTLTDETFRVPLETLDLALVDRLREGDIFFLDSSHRSFQNSDVTVFFLEILPRLAPGVLIHVHDIYLPEDYPSGHVGRRWNEQYLLAAVLMFGGDRFETVFPSWYVSREPALAAEKDRLLRVGPLSELSIHGASYWFRKLPGR
jgi:tetratricopeptide (TPR) repeat protein